MWPGLSDYLLSITTGWYSVSRVLGWSNLTLPSGPKYSCKPPVSKKINFKHHNFSLNVVLTFLHSHVFNLNVLHELVDYVLCVYPASVQLSSLALLSLGAAWGLLWGCKGPFRRASEHNRDPHDGVTTFALLRLLSEPKIYDLIFIFTLSGLYS